MTLLRGHLLLAVAVLFGSAIPFVPTGEMVSGAAAVAAHSEIGLLEIFGIVWICSILGDALMLGEARWAGSRLRGRIARSRMGPRVEQAQEALSRNAFTAVLTGRLVPGGRTPVIVALGLSRFPLRRFLALDTVACGLWAAVYASIGSLGGRVANHPVLAMALAIVIATGLGVVVQQVHRRLERRRRAAS